MAWVAIACRRGCGVTLQPRFFNPDIDDIFTDERIFTLDRNWQEAASDQSTTLRYPHDAAEPIRNAC